MTYRNEPVPPPTRSFKIIVWTSLAALVLCIHLYSEHFVRAPEGIQQRLLGHVVSPARNLFASRASSLWYPSYQSWSLSIDPKSAAWLRRLCRRPELSRYYKPPRYPGEPCLAAQGPSHLDGAGTERIEIGDTSMRVTRTE